MTLDELEPVCPLWLVVLLVVRDAGPAGLSVTRTAANVNVRSGGRYGRAQSVADMLRRFRDAGVVEAREETSGGRLPAKMHTLTEYGVLLIVQARESFSGMVRQRER